MSTSLTERLVNKVALRRGGTSRRGFLGGAALVGAALAVDPWGYLSRPASAIDAICGSDSSCAAGYTVFCCTINAGRNTCPPDSFIGGWWKADNSSFCGGSARYYIDCNAYRDGRYSCHCNTTTCDQRRVACNQFRYGQCNTQIPYSNTGTVLCRVISCTPPWVQYGGVCSSSAATDNNTASHTAPCLHDNLPIGNFEAVSAAGNIVTLHGWAYDPNQPASSIRVAVYQDNKPVKTVVANLARPDVDTARHISGNHGFTASVAATTGVHTYTCYAINVAAGTGNPQIGSHSIDVNPGSPPIGSLDVATATGNQVLLEGWAWDRDDPTGEVQVIIYQDGKALTYLHTTVSRPDVNAAYRTTGLHGFSMHITATPGRHNYQVYAQNLGRGSGFPLLGSRDVVVGAATSGQLRVRPAGAGSVRLSGQAGDPDDPDARVSVAIYEDSHVLHWLEVDAHHRFDVTVPAGAGVHTYTGYPVNGELVLPALGSRTVAVDQTGPLGQVERIEVFGNAVRISGWAFDPDRPAATVPVTVFRDGAPLVRVAGGLARADINRDYGAAGDAGFDIELAAEPGRHTYTVYAVSLAPDLPDSLIGGRTLAVADAGAQPAAEVLL
ncbi:MAG: twin-arginine translocation signal domain-containing protein [Jatrophihabitans sp.]